MSEKPLPNDVYEDSFGGLWRVVRPWFDGDELIDVDVQQRGAACLTRLHAAVFRRELRRSTRSWEAR
jgi:hypothetical protein